MKFKVRFNETKQKFGAKFGEIQRITEYLGGELYEGSYEITPQTDVQILPTAQKVLEQDLKINEIPYAEVSNHTGGTTATIG